MEEEFHVLSMVIGVVAFLVVLFFSFRHRILAFYLYVVFWGGLLFLGLKLNVDYAIIHQVIPSIVGSMIGLMFGFWSSAIRDIYANKYRRKKLHRRLTRTVVRHLTDDED